MVCQGLRLESHELLADSTLERPALTAVVPRVHVDGATAARSLVYKVLPEIPRAARETNTYSMVVLHAVIGTDGMAHDLRYISGPQSLVQATMEAVRWYKYRLPIVDEEPSRAEEVEPTVAVLLRSSRQISSSPSSHPGYV